MTRAPVTVVIPTFDRPEGLTRAVLSVFSQTLTEQDGFALVIVDNHPDGTGAQAIEALRAQCPGRVTLTALHEPRAGVANARNAAMTKVETHLVAFLDDDMTAPDDWLELLLNAYKAHPAPVTFGPVITSLPEDVHRHRAYFETFFARNPGHKTGLISKSYGCGNSLMDFSKIPGSTPWFDETMNEIGGEDDRLFDRVRRAGLDFAWAANAPVYEHPLRKRLTLNYTLRRAFSYGQAPVTLARLATPSSYTTIVKWMMIGGGKACLHGTAWVALSLVRHPKRAFQLDKAIRGMSKVFWFFDFKFYGVSALKTSPPALTMFTQRPRSAGARADEV